MCVVFNLAGLWKSEYGRRWLFTLSEVYVDWQAFTEIAVYNRRVFILASLQQPQNIKQNLSDSGCALGECNMFCCLVSWRVLCCVFLLVLGRVVWRMFVVQLLPGCLIQTHCCRQTTDSHGRPSWGLRAALSEMGSERDSASLTETERRGGADKKVILRDRSEALNIYPLKGFIGYAKGSKAEGKGKAQMEQGTQRMLICMMEWRVGGQMYRVQHKEPSVADRWRIITPARSLIQVTITTKW